MNDETARNDGQRVNGGSPSGRPVAVLLDALRDAGLLVAVSDVILTTSPIWSTTAGVSRPARASSR